MITGHLRKIAISFGLNCRTSAGLPSGIKLAENNFPAKVFNVSLFFPLT